jgi:hypothetical protein
MSTAMEESACAGSASLKEVAKDVVDARDVVDKVVTFPDH